MKELLRVPLLRTVVLSSIAFALVIASLGIDQTAHNATEARHLGFGYPLHFATSNFACVYTPRSWPQTYNLNPWEIPVHGNPITFFVSWLLVYGALLACWLLIRHMSSIALRRAKRIQR